MTNRVIWAVGVPMVFAFLGILSTQINVFDFEQTANAQLAPGASNEIGDPPSTPSHSPTQSEEVKEPTEPAHNQNTDNFAPRALPVADASGPYVCLPENRDDAGWTFTFDGSGSSADGFIENWLWEFPVQTFDGHWLNTYEWITLSAYNDDALHLRGTNAWSSAYAVTREKIVRQEGASFRARVTYHGTDTVWGFKNTTNIYHHNAFDYGIYLHSDGNLYVYENGANRGLRGNFTIGEPIDLRVDLKQDGGAIYYAKYPEEDWEGHIIYDSTHSTLNLLRAGATVHNGLLMIDDVQLFLGGETVSHKVYEPGTVTLTVTDDIGQKASDIAEIVVENPELTPDAGGPYMGTEATQVDAGWIFDFDASATLTPFEIIETHWDLGYDTFPGQWLNPYKWNSAGVYANDGAILNGPNNWNHTHLVRQDAIPRTTGAFVEIRATLNNTYAVFGLKADTTIYHYNQYHYCIMSSTDNQIYIYEGGTHRATPASYIPGEVYDLRIEVKQDRGARYFMKLASEEEWATIYDSPHDNAMSFHPAVTVHTGQYVIHSWQESFWGSPANYKIYAETAGMLTVTDSNRQSASVPFDVEVDPPTPTADAGGPYAISEADFDTVVNGYLVDLDATNSTGGHEIVRYEWDFGPDTFDGMFFDFGAYYGSGAWQSDGAYIAGVNGWNNRYLFSKHPVERAGGAYVEASIVSDGGHAMWGLKTNNTNFHYNQLAYAFYFVSGGQVHIYENGTSRGYFADITPGETYQVAIVLKNVSGASYYLKHADDTDWTLVYDSAHSSVSGLLPGVTVNSGVFNIASLSQTYYGPTTQHRISEPTSVTLNVADILNQTSTETVAIDIVGSGPIADSGGPLMLSEAELLGSGYASLALDASGSSDDFEIAKYQWDLGTLTFDGQLHSQVWLFAGANVSGGELQLTGTGGWGGHHFFSRVPAVRADGTIFECKVRPGNGVAMFGFKNTSTNYSYTQLPYAIYFNNSTAYIYEDGASRGAVTGYDPAGEYELRIELKPTQGARYFLRPVGGQWRMLYNSNHSAATNLLRGVTMLSGTMYFDDFRHLYGSPTQEHRITGEISGSLTVWDRAGRTDSDPYEVIITGGEPVADAGGPYTSPMTSYAIFDALNSFDDIGIQTYLWNFGDGTAGFGGQAYHRYDQPGIYDVTLTVFDAAGHSDTATTTVEVIPAVVCVPWDYDNTSGLEVPHNTWSGRDATLKARVFTDTPADQLTYTWIFGDGSPAEMGNVTNKRSIETTHTYEGAAGAVFVASLTIHDPVYGDLTDTYPIQIHQRDLTIEVNVSIDRGIWWLHKEQADNGTWNQSGYFAGATASAVHAMEINGHLPTRSVLLDPLVDDVIRGLEATLTRLNAVPITVQPAGDPDTNANGIGIQVNSNRPIYEGGMVMDALAATGAPDMAANNGGNFINGRAFRDILYDMGDMYAWGQVDSGNARGGWRYSWNSGSDNSAAQWAAIGFEGARSAFGLVWPDWVRTENDIWLSYSYDGTGFGYAGPGNGEATTPSGMVQLAYDGFTRNDSRWQTSEAWIANNWEWWKARNNTYAYYAFAKAMRLALPEPIAELSPTGLDWYNDDAGLVRRILDLQSADGGWPNPVNWIHRQMTTAWHVIILTPTLFTRPPVAVAGDDIVWAFDLALDFDGSASYHTDPVRVLVEYEWDFDGDGTYDYIGSDPVATYTFVYDDNINYPITYEARLRVTDDIGQTDTDTRGVTIAEPPHPPIANIGGPYEARTNLPFTIDPSGSVDIDPTDYITKLQFDFDGSNGYDFDQPDLEIECSEPAPGEPQTGGCTAVTWTYNTSGTYNIGMRVWDNGVLNAPDDEPLPSNPNFTTVTVSVNQAPIADAGGPYEGDECSPIQLDGSGSHDPDQDGLTFAWDLNDDGVYDDSTDPAPNYTWNADGVYTAWLIVSDGALDSEPAQAEVIVFDGAPSISVGGPTNLDIDAIGQFFATVSSECDAVALIEWDWDYDGIAFNASGDIGENASHSYTAQGTYTVAARVIDIDDSTAMATHVVVVGPPEGPRIPADNKITYTIGRRDYDPVNQIHRAEFTLISEHDEPMYGPIGLAFADVYPSTVELITVAGYVPHPDNETELIPYADFTPLLTDNVLLPDETVGPMWIAFSDPDNVSFTFEAIGFLFNTAPRFTSTPILTGSEGTRYRYDANAVDDDEDAFDYSLEEGPAGMTINPTTGLVDWIPDQQSSGVHDVTIVANDGRTGGAVYQTYQLTIDAVNVSPIITSVPITAASAVDGYTYQIQAYDPDSDPIDYDLLVAPAEMIVDADGLVDWPTPSVGYHQVKVVVFDDHDNEASQEFTLNVSACNQPSFTTTPITAATEGEFYTYQVAVDGPNPPYVFDLPIAPQGMTIVAANGQIEWTPSYTQAGGHVVKVLAKENGNNPCSAEQIFQVIVAGVNAAPQITSVPPVDITEGEAYVYNVEANDPDEEEVTFTLVEGPEGMSILPSVGRVSWFVPQTAAMDCNHPCHVHIRACDPALECDEQLFTLNITEVNVAPQFTGLPLFSAAEEELYTFTPIVEDPDDDALSFELLDGPVGMTIDPLNGTVEWTPNQTDASRNPHFTQIKATDEWDAFDVLTYQIMVQSVNVAPTINSSAPTTATEGVLYNYPVQANDIDEDELRFRLLESPSGMSVHPNNGLITWVPSQVAAMANPHTVTVEVYDPDNDMDQQTFAITVAEVNVAPEFFSTPVVQGVAGFAYEYDVEAFDPDQDTIEFGLDQFPDGMTINANTGLIAWNPGPPNVGLHDIIVTADDLQGHVSTQSYTLEILECGTAPEFISNPITRAEVDELYQYQVVVEADAPVLFSLGNAPASMTIDENTGLVQWTPTTDDEGTYNVRIIAASNEGCEAYQEFTLEAKLCVLTVEYLFGEGENAEPDAGRFWTATPTVDATCGPLEFMLLQNPSTMSINPNTGVLSWVPASGDWDIIVYVVDDWGNTLQINVPLTVAPQHSPQITSTPTFTAAVDALYTYDVEANDPDDDPIEFSLDEAPAGMTIDADTGMIEWTPTIGHIGVHNVRVRASDDRGAWAAQIYTLMVSQFGDNVSPQIVTTPTYSSAVDDEYTYDVDATDGDQDTVQFGLDEAPAGMTIDAASGVITWTPTVEQIGVHSVTVRATDGRGGWATQTYSVTVSLFGDNLAPSILSTPNFSAAVGALYVYAVEAEDPDVDDELTFLLLPHESVAPPAGMAINEETGWIEWLPAEEDLGTYTIHVRVEDGRGGWASQVYSLTASLDGTNTPPRITSTPDYSAAANTLYTYDVNATDDEDDALAFDLADAPQTMTIDGNNGLIEWTPASDDTGVHDVHVQVTDGRGGWAEQVYTLTVSIDGTNVAPRFTSTPLTAVLVNTAYSYDANAVDDNEGDVTTYSLDNAPPTMSIDENSGLVTWTPGEDDFGSHAVTIRAIDNELAYATQEYELLVKANTTPVFESQPLVTAVVDYQYDYPAYATDVDNHAITYQLVPAEVGDPVVEHPVPEGMTVVQPTTATGPGHVLWTPTMDQAGEHYVSILAADGNGGEVTQTYLVTVYEDDSIDFRAPDVDITIEPAFVSPGGSVTITVFADDDTGLSTVMATLDGENLPLTMDSATTWVATANAPQPGRYDITATATDAFNKSRTDNAYFMAIDDTDDAPPIVEILTPEDDVETAEPISIVGTVMDDQLVAWTLSYAPAHTDDFVEFDSGSTSVDDAEIGVFDVSMVPNGLYEVKLTAMDEGGWEISTSVRVLVESDAQVGNFTMTFPDLNVPTVGIPVNVMRRYDSRIKRKGDFGIGWDLEIASAEVIENDDMHEGWETGSGGGWLPTYYIAPDRLHSVTIDLGDGRTDTFDMQLDPMQMLIYSYWDVNVTWRRRGQGLSKLTSNPSSGLAMTGAPLLNWEFDDWAATSFTYTDHNGVEYTFAGDENRKQVVQIKDTNGNTVSITENGIFHSTGPSVVFERDNQKRITKITDPAGGEILYAYDDRGDLISVTDQEGHTTWYDYNRSHGLYEIEDPTGNTPVRNEYDDDNRLIATVDGDGNRIEFNHDIDNQQELVYDRLGNLSIYYYDDDGNVTQITDPGNHDTTYTFDEHGNLLTKVDYLGNVTENTYTDDGQIESRRQFYQQSPTVFTYDADGRMLTQALPNGLVKTRAYEGEDRLPITVSDNMGRSTTYTRKPDGQQDSKTVLLTEGASATWIYEYDEQGRMTAEIGPLGNRTEYVYNELGQRTGMKKWRTNPEGETELLEWTFEYDALGQLVTETNPMGYTRSYTYDAVGNRATVTNWRGFTTSYEYNGRGDRIAKHYPDDSSEFFEYDAEQNRTAVINRGGHRTDYEYNYSNKLVKTLHEDGSYSDVAYDGLGRMTSQRDENGSVTTYEYITDAANGIHRQIVTDPFDKVTVYDFDDMNRRTQTTDANEHVTEFEYDLAGRHIKTTFHDGTFVSYEYDWGDRKIAEVDQAGRRTEFEYDLLDRLVKVTNAADEVTLYEYDELGNLRSSTDAEGRTTEYEYDKLGRMLKRILPNGLFESMTYDENGNLLTHTDFEGRTATSAYDNMDRRTSRSYEDGTSEVFTYASCCNSIETVTDQHGLTTYTYDDRSRLESVTCPSGESLEYGYDSSNNRTSITSSLGTTGYTYDALNRVETVTDSQGLVTTYVYNDVGNLASVHHANGTIITYMYDDLNRLVHVSHTLDDTGDLLAGFEYTLEAAGNRTQVVEFDANGVVRTVNYDYDDVYRLTREEMTPAIGDTVVMEYLYDSVGNRLFKNVAAGSIFESTAYTYDVNDRLMQEVRDTFDGGNPSDSETIIYGYDLIGHLTSKSNGTWADTYTYNQAGRLVNAHVESGGSTEDIAYTYNYRGIRTSKTIGGVTTEYVVDHNRRHAQVLAEITPSGSTGYVHGLDLISMKLPGGAKRFYHGDGQLSTRLLTDGAGAVTDTYIYDAFGNTLASTGNTPNRYKYTGEQYDPNLGYYYLRQRYLDTGTGRFVAADKFPADRFDPKTLHRYLYVQSNPVNMVDPSGEFGSLVEVNVSLAIQNTLISSYHSHLLQFFFKAMKIAFCVLEPAFQQRNIALDAIAQGAGDWAITMEAQARQQISIGFNDLRKALMDEMEGFAEDILPQLEWEVTIDIVDKGLQDHIDALEAAHQDITGAVDFASDMVDFLNKMMEMWNAPSEACAVSIFLEAYGVSILEKVGVL